MSIERIDLEQTTRTMELSNKREISAEHLEKLDQGRKEGAIVRHYLDALENLRPKRGRKPDLNKLKSRLTELEQRIQDSNESNATRLNLIQERKDLVERLSVTKVDKSEDLQKFEDEFVQIAASYARRRGIEYDSFKSVGVPVRVLKRAGIPRKTSSAA